MHIKPMGEHSVDELAGLQLAVEAEGAGISQRELTYALGEAPQGARIEPRTGQFSWTPSEEQGPGRHSVTVVATGPRGLKAQQQFTVLVNEVNQAPEFTAIPEQAATISSRRTTFKMKVAAEDRDLPRQTLRYQLEPGCPKGATIDAQSGMFEWRPGLAEPGRTYQFTVRATDSADSALSSTVSFNVRLGGYAKPIDKLIAWLQAYDARMKLIGREGRPKFKGSSRVFEMEGERIYVYEYQDAAALEADARQVSPDAEMMFGQRKLWRAPAFFFKTDGMIVYYSGVNLGLAKLLKEYFGVAFASTRAGYLKPDAEDPE